MPCGKIEAFQEATQDFVAVQARAYQLDGHLLAEFAVRAHRQIHAGHTPMPHPPYELVHSQPTPGHDVFFPAWGGGYQYSRLGFEVSRFVGAADPNNRTRCGVGRDLGRDHSGKSCPGGPPARTRIDPGDLGLLLGQQGTKVVECERGRGY
jgi:hypothetical protein